MASGHALTATPYSHLAGAWFEQLCLMLKWLSETGVPLFFVISGFCIHLAQSRHEGLRRFDFVAFWKRRIWRLYPTYAVVLAGSIALLYGMLWSGAGEEVLARYPEPRATWIAIDAGVHAVMLHGLHPFFDKEAGNPPFWTLAREEYLYLLYPVILVMRRRWSWPRIAGLLAGVTITIELLSPAVAPTAAWSALLTSSAPALWIQWCLGAIAADVYRGVRQLPTVFQQARWIPVWLVLAYVAPFSTVSLAAAYFTAVNVCVRLEREGRWRDRGTVRAVTHVGLWSYSLYLVHHPVQTVALALWLRLLPADGVLMFVIRAACLTVISCGAARLLFAIVERHFVSQPRDAPAPMHQARTEQYAP